MFHKSLKLNCPVCDGLEFRYIFRKGNKNFARCINCHFEIVYPMPTESELRAYYDSSYSEGMYKLFVEAAEMKSINANYRFREVSKYIKGNTLDVGCSDGHLLNILKQNGLTAEGIDISQIAIDHAINKGLRAYCSTLAAFKPGYKYQAIIGLDILEHLIDPKDFILSIKELLEMGGSLILSTPNRRSIQRRLMGKYWYFYIPEEHMLYFDTRTIKMFLTRNGFTIVKMKRFLKPLTLQYGLSQFKEYNPFIYKVMRLFSNLIPDKLMNKSIPFYIGEMLVIATLTKK